MGTLWLGSQAVEICAQTSHLPPTPWLSSGSNGVAFQSCEPWDHPKGFTLEYHFLICCLCTITGKAAFCPVPGMVGWQICKQGEGDTTAATILCFLTLAAGDPMTGSASKHLQTFISGWL